MSRDRKWASNPKDKLLVENFKKFVEEGDFRHDLEEKSQAEMSLGSRSSGEEVVAHALMKILRTQPSGMSAEGLKNALPQYLEKLGVDAKENMSYFPRVFRAIEGGRGQWPSVDGDGKANEFEAFQADDYDADGNKRGKSWHIKLV